MILVALSTWIVFCIRDYCLLRTSPPGKFRRRVRLYALTVLIAAAGAMLVRRQALSPALLGAAVGGHLAMAAFCVWLARRGSSGSVWRLALAPLPAPWILLIMAAGDLYPGNGGWVILTAAAAWILVLSLAARLDSPDTVDADEVDFSMRFAVWSNCTSWCLVPLMTQ